MRTERGSQGRALFLTGTYKESMAEKIKVALRMQRDTLYVKPAGFQEGREVHGQTVIHGSAVDEFLDTLPWAVFKDLVSGWKLVAEIPREDYEKYRKRFATRK
jgi:hypothetical protein